MRLDRHQGRVCARTRLETTIGKGGVIGGNFGVGQRALAAALHDATYREPGTVTGKRAPDLERRRGTCSRGKASVAEQDAGKSIHDMDPHMSFVDLHRTGVALMEIVSRPDIRGPEEAAAYVGKLRQIMRYLGTCDGNMQNGNLRADVNVSICRPGQYEKYMETQDFSHLGTRCEIKNMNSMRFIQQATG